MKPHNMDFIRRTEGWLTDEAIHYFAAAAANVPLGGVIVEIGAWKGKSAATFALNCDPTVQVWSIDHFRGSPEHALIQRDEIIHGHWETHVNLPPNHHFICAPSEIAATIWSRQIDLLFIDGAHDYISVLSDFTLWSRHLTPSGLLILHDAGHTGAWSGPASQRDAIADDSDNWTTQKIGPDFAAFKRCN